MYGWLPEVLSQGAVVVTASRRLSRELGHVHDQNQLAAGCKAWITPDIQFVGHWLSSLLESCPDPELLPVTINAQTSAILWEQCLARSMQGTLPGFTGMVRQCRMAAFRLKDWRVPAREIALRAAGAEQRQFAAAAKNYAKVLEKNNWIDEAAIPELLATLILRGAIVLPSRVYMVGFDRVWPALTAVLDVMGEAGVLVENAGNRERASDIDIASFDSGQAELRTAGAWARSELMKNPDLRVAVICPDLEKHAAGVARLVREGFAPGWQYGSAAHRESVNVSYGQAMADYPAIGIGLMLLRWVQGGLWSSEVGILLRSSSIGEVSGDGRCRLEIALRRLPERCWHSADLLHTLRNSDLGRDADQWCEYMQHIVEAGDRSADKNSPAIWAGYFDQLLTSAGWPGSGPQDSKVFQLIKRWHELLNELAQLEVILPAMSFSEAVSRLVTLASETVFQPQPEHSRLPVIGVLEAAGMEFDKIWLCGFDAGHWPSRGQPLTFVSRQLQQDFDMPDATPQDSLEFSHRVIQRILHSTEQLVVSWAKSDDGVEQQPSPLLSAFDNGQSASYVDPQWHAAALLKNELLVFPDEDPTPAVGRHEKINGGAYTVQQQASDPFAAFAFGRMGVSALSPFEPGLSASARGSAIHQALHEVFAKKPSRAELCLWSEQERLTVCRAAAKRGLSNLGWNADAGLRKIMQMEQARTEQLLMRFLETETKRDDFQVVMVEQSLQYHEYGVSLHLRVDRVDQLADGSLLVIDYKTGVEKTLLDRRGELKDLQLMVYAIVLEGDIGGLALINLDSRKISFKGSVQDDNWPSCFDAWARQTVSAIQALASGDARVNMADRAVRSKALNVLSRFEELRRG